MVMLAVPLRNVYSHPEHLLLEALFVVTESASEEKEASAVGLTLTHKNTRLNCSTINMQTHLGGTPFQHILNKLKDFFHFIGYPVFIWRLWYCVVKVCLCL